ncbi:MAG TPA: hypothetical protein VGJ16_00410 [Pirellulales bacterium]
MCERRGLWATALARHLAYDVHMVQIRAVGQCAAELERGPAGFLVLEVGRDNLAGVLELLAELEWRFPAARALVVAPRDMLDYEWLLREAGAVHFCVSPREGELLARVAERHLRGAAQPIDGPVARLWAQVAWTR